MITLIILILLTINVIAQDSVPTMINYQGFLTDTTGQALTGSYNITFRIYPDTSTLNDDWIEEQSVYVEQGLYNVLLGNSSSLTADILNGDKYLGITVEGEIEMEPRMRLVSVAYSLRAEEANNTHTIDNFRIITGYVTAAGTGSGNGFTSTKTATGTYSINFTDAFSSTPNVMVTGRGHDPLDNWWTVYSVTNSSAEIRSSDDNPSREWALQDANFNFIVIGTR